MGRPEGRTPCRALLLGGAALLAAGCAQANGTPPTGRGAAIATASGIPAAAAQAAPTEDGQWIMPAKNYAATRFSGLDQIKASNVARLGLAWTFSTGVTHGHEAAPLVVGSTMYVLTPYPNYLHLAAAARHRHDHHLDRRDLQREDAALGLAAERHPAAGLVPLLETPARVGAGSAEAALKRGVRRVAPGGRAAARRRSP